MGIFQSKEERTSDDNDMGIFQSKEERTSDDSDMAISSEDEDEPEMRDSVSLALAQPLLLEMILDYAMRDENVDLYPAKKFDLCPDTIQNLRLVQKSWKEAVSKKLLQNKEPLFRLTLNNKKSIITSECFKINDKLVNQFVDYWSTGNYGAVPTFRLEVEVEYLILQENYHSFINCLNKCGVGLVEIDMHVPINCGYFHGFLKNVTFPILNKLAINFTGYTFEWETEEASRSPFNLTLLFKSLLTGSKCLKQLVLTSDYWGLLDHEFPAAQHVKLPSSLTSIEINFKGAENILEILTWNYLPNLRSLTLGISSESRISSVLSQILENVRKTLRYLKLQGEEYFETPRQPNLLLFPVMKQLKTLEIHRVYFELKRKIEEMEHFFPKLETLVLCEQTEEMLGKWTTGGGWPCTTVKKVALELVDESRPRSTINTLPLTLEAIQSVHWKFPNVVHLNLDVYGWEASGLNYIFGEMRQLTSLEINVHGAQSLAGSNHWDSVLIGVPFNFVELLAAGSDYFRDELRNEHPSIRMLENLSSFSLTEAVVYNDDDEDDLDDDQDDLDDDQDDLDDDVDDYSENPLISDLAFVYGFLEMPKLTELNFSGRFEASEEMCSEWEKTGRTINYWEGQGRKVDDDDD